MGLVKGLIEACYPAIYPVNPKYSEVLGLKCYASILEIPEIVDHVIVSIPVDGALALLDDCITKRVRSVHFFTAGFSESGIKERGNLENELVKKARANGIRIIGPNSAGLFVPKSRIVSMQGMPLEPGPVGFISQSGGNAQELPFHAKFRGINFSKVVSYGNALDLDESELLEYFAHDSETKIIAGYIEGVKNGKRFRKALEMVSNTNKPIILYKGGITNTGLRATLGHTASLTSSVSVFEAFCRQMNVIRADNVQELIDLLVAFSFIPGETRGKGIAVFGVGGSSTVLASDEIEAEGLHMPQFSDKVQTELKQVLLNDGSIFGNPIDAINLIQPNAIATSMRIASNLPEVDLLIYHLGAHSVSRWGNGFYSSPEYLSELIGSFEYVQRETGKHVILTLYPAPDLAGAKEFFAVQNAVVAAGFPVFHSFSQCARAIGRMMNWKNKTMNI